MTHIFAHVEFEGASDKVTEEIVEELYSVKGYSHITGYAGMLYFAFTGKTFKEVRDIVQSVIWKHNHGLFCEVVERTEEEFDKMEIL